MPSSPPGAVRIDRDNRDGRGIPDRWSHGESQAPGSGCDPAAGLFDDLVAFVGRRESVEALAVELGPAPPEAIRVGVVLAVPLVLTYLGEASRTPIGSRWLGARLSSLDIGPRPLSSYADVVENHRDAALGDGVLAMVLGPCRYEAARALSARAGLEPIAADRVLAATARSVMVVLASRYCDPAERIELPRVLGLERRRLYDAGWGPWIDAAVDGSDTGLWALTADRDFDVDRDLGASRQMAMTRSHPVMIPVTGPSPRTDGMIVPSRSFSAGPGRRRRWATATAAVAVASVAIGGLAVGAQLLQGTDVTELLTTNPAELTSGRERPTADPAGSTAPEATGGANGFSNGPGSATADTADNTAGSDGGEGQESAAPSSVAGAAATEDGFTPGPDGAPGPGQDMTGALVVVGDGSVTLTGEVPDQATADELVASFAGIDLGGTELVDELRVVPGAPLPSGRIIVGGEILFDFDSARLVDPEGTVVRDLAAIFIARPAWAVMVVGYTDNSGPEEYNIDLSLQRATAVRDALVDAGVPPEALDVRGAGPADPIATNETREGRIRNRRIEFEVTAVSD